MKVLYFLSLALLLSANAVMHANDEFVKDDETEMAPDDGSHMGSNEDLVVLEPIDYEQTI
jgi:hypothetical protein